MKVSEKVLDVIRDYLNKENKISLSLLFFFVGGTFEFVYFLSKIVPFTIKKESWLLINLIKKVNLQYTLNDNSEIVNIAFFSILVYLLLAVIGKFIMRLLEYKKNSIFGKAEVILYTLTDCLELFISIISIVFMFSTYVELYYTGNILFTYKTTIIYFMTAYKSLDLVYHRIYFRYKIIASKV